MTRYHYSGVPSYKGRYIVTRYKGRDDSHIRDENLTITIFKHKTYINGPQIRDD